MESLADAAAVASRACELWRRQARASVAARGVFRAALSGGRTPALLFERLAAAALPWKSTELFWVDERYVPHGHAESNFALARELLLGRVPIPEAQVHPMPTGSGEPARDAAAYEALLRTVFAGRSWPGFDLCLLGLGEDGHTASLFPGGPELVEKRRWVLATRSPKGVADRLSLSIPALVRSGLCLFLACGTEKSAAFKAALGRPAGPASPARLVWSAAARGVFLLDKQAAGGIPPGQGAGWAGFLS
ncbi:MAG: 6-phosphogluconolactonase [Elusimicrobia bacterium]|nr:6-phosphogluconolactonase [Elusimicrobiota bacterium]